MYKIDTLKNGLTLITVPMPHLDSVTSLVAVGVGSRYETKKINGISHFLEHMFFKGSKKYPTHEIISSLIDGIGAVNNAATDKEVTFYWIKSAAKHLELSADILSSMIKESLLQEEEIEREKGVIAEELRMYKDAPQRYIWDLYDVLQFGDQPLGWDIGGKEEITNALTRKDLVDYMSSFYSPKNMALVFAGKIPANIKKIAESYFSDLATNTFSAPKPYKKIKQSKPQVGIYYKKTDQANLILGVEGYKEEDPRKYAAKLLGVILGEGMSSRLFIQVRERRGLAYTVSAGHDTFKDTGSFKAFAGLKLEKVEEGVQVIKDELEKTTHELVTEEELKKAKEIVRGRISLRSESTNFLAEYFGINYVVDRKIESFAEHLTKIDKVTREDIQKVAKDLFKNNKYNLQIIGPFKSKTAFEKILQG